jgi:hypothetical protein
MHAIPNTVPLVPDMYAGFPCPSCGAAGVRPMGSAWPGIHVMGRYHCPACGLRFLRDLPVGFAVDHPMAIAEPEGRLFNPTNGPEWIHRPLLEGHGSPSTEEVKVERIVHRECRRVVILNTLDYLYGHVLLKLYNAPCYLDNHPDTGLIVLLPRMFLWLVPQGVAEVWVVDQPLGRAQRWSTAIDRFVQQQLPRYEEVALGMGYAHPEFAGMDISRFSGIAPFPLEEFTERPPHVTFVVREDRLWYAGPGAKFIHRALGRLGLRSNVGRWQVHAQDRLVRRTMRRVRRVVPGVRFTVVGLGAAGGMGAAVEDLRTRRMDRETELAWCRAYARSQVVVGVHGSNMLLPTAHAAGCVEILPYDRYGNIVQDISVRWADRMQLFLYRFTDEFATPRAMARHIGSMFTDFPVYFRDNRINIFHRS